MSAGECADVGAVGVEVAAVGEVEDDEVAPGPEDAVRLGEVALDERGARLHEVGEGVHRVHEVEELRLEEREVVPRALLEVDVRQPRAAAARRPHHLHRDVDPVGGAHAARERPLEAPDPAADLQHRAVGAERPPARQLLDDLLRRAAQQLGAAQRVEGDARLLRLLHAPVEEPLAEGDPLLHGRRGGARVDVRLQHVHDAVDAVLVVHEDARQVVHPVAHDRVGGPRLGVGARRHLVHRRPHHGRALALADHLHQRHLRRHGPRQAARQDGPERRRLDPRHQPLDLGRRHRRTEGAGRDERLGGWNGLDHARGEREVAVLTHTPFPGFGSGDGGFLPESEVVSFLLSRSSRDSP